MAHLLEVDIEKTLIFQGITLDIIGRHVNSEKIALLGKDDREVLFTRTAEK